jgi:hypothetical protein
MLSPKEYDQPNTSHRKKEEFKGLYKKTNNIINTTSTQSSSSPSTLEKLYNNTLEQYEKLMTQMNGSATDYLSRVNPNNPYLNKTVRFTTGHIAYVTNQGAVKYIPSMDIWNSVNAPKQYTQLTVAWDDSWNNAPGSIIPTTPPLVSGTFMKLGQSLGNEGTNVYVNTMISSSTPEFEGCFADNISSPLMTFIGDKPPPIPPKATIQNENFNQPKMPNNTYRYITSSSEVPGWNFNAVLVNNSGAWGFSMPYPNGPQCVSIQNLQSICQTVSLQSNTQYTISLIGCGRPCGNNPSCKSNPININLFTVDNQFISTIYHFEATVNVWTNYSTTFTVPSSQNYQICFSGTNAPGDLSTALQNIQLTVKNSSSTTNGSYTYDQCQAAAIEEGYQYFALQRVNTSTSLGYCAASNSQPTATSLGTGTVSNEQVGLWASMSNNPPGLTVTLTNTGALSVLDQTGKSIFSTPNVNAKPGNYLGCYADKSDRAMTVQSSTTSTLQQCQDLATKNGSTYFGLQNSTCSTSNDFVKTTQYGAAGNCTQNSTDNSWVGGAWSNAVYNTSSDSNYYLILQDDGDMCIYRGTGPTDNQGLIWSAGTKGKQQQSNPLYISTNGKYGKNWVVSGSTLSKGDFIGSTNGSTALIFQPDGNLVLYTFSMVSSCSKMSDGKTGGGLNSNALYNIGKIGVKSLMGLVGYIDQNSDIHTYPSTNTTYTDSYTKIPKYDAAGNDINNAIYTNATIEQCAETCNSTNNCVGYAFKNNTCYPKKSIENKTKNNLVDLYVRNKSPLNPPMGVTKSVTNIDSVSYNKYINGGEISSSYGIANATESQKQKLEQLQLKMNTLSGEMASSVETSSVQSQQAINQLNENRNGIEDYLKQINTTDTKINQFNNNNNVENILNDSDIIVLQKNYEYLFWSIIATGTVLVTMNIVKK